MTDSLSVLRMELRHEGDHIEVLWKVLGPAGQSSSGGKPAEGQPGFSWNGYYVSSHTIDGLGRMIREHLQSLQGIDWKLDNLTSSAAQYGPILAQLAGAGQSLHAAIMRGVEGDDLSEMRANKFRAWFEKDVIAAPVGAWRIEVVHTTYSKQIAPWGLAFTPTKKEAIAALDPANPDDYSNFWAARFKLAVRGSAIDPENNERDGSQIGLACVLELDSSAVTQIESWDRPGESDNFQRHIRWDRDGYQDLAKQNSRNDLFWYISLQADGGAFRLGREKIDPIDLDANRGRSNQDRVVLMMLDGDAVIRNDRGHDWIERALNIGQSGLIAVEADIRNPQVRHYGWRVLQTILMSRLPLIDAVAKIRREHWPLALLYGVYCSPVHVAVTPPPEDTIHKIDEWLRIIRDAEISRSAGGKS